MSSGLIRKLLTEALEHSGLTDPVTGEPLHVTPHDFPAQHDRLLEIRDNLLARIAEAEREGWLGEIEGLQVSLAGAEDKLAQAQRRRPGQPTVSLGLPSIKRS